MFVKYLQFTTVCTGYIFKPWIGRPQMYNSLFSTTELSLYLEQASLRSRQLWPLPRGTVLQKTLNVLYTGTHQFKKKNRFFFHLEFNTQCLYSYYPKYLLSWLVLCLPLGNIFLHFLQKQLCQNATKVVGCATDDILGNRLCFRVRGGSEQGKGLDKRKDQLLTYQMLV